MEKKIVSIRLDQQDLGRLRQRAIFKGYVNYTAYVRKLIKDDLNESKNWYQKINRVLTKNNNYET